MAQPRAQHRRPAHLVLPATGKPQINDVLLDRDELLLQRIRRCTKISRAAEILHPLSRRLDAYEHPRGRIDITLQLEEKRVGGLYVLQGCARVRILAHLDGLRVRLSVDSELYRVGTGRHQHCQSPDTRRAACAVPLHREFSVMEGPGSEAGSDCRIVAKIPVHAIYPSSPRPSERANGFT